MKVDVPRITRSQYAIQTIDALFDRPIFQTADFVSRSGIPKNTAWRILNRLRESDIVHELRPHVDGAGRSWSFLNCSRLWRNRFVLHV